MKDYKPKKNRFRGKIDVLLQSCCLLVMIVLLNQVCKYYITTEVLQDMEEEIPAVRILESEESKAIENISFAIRQNRFNRRGADTEIDLWQDANGQKFLFLPSAASDRLFLVVPEGDQIWIDGMAYTEGENVNLVPGEHYLQLFENMPEEKIIVLQSGGLGTIFLDTESGSLEQLQADKEHQETGEYTVFDQDGDCIAASKLSAINCRGNVSFLDTDKKSYSLKLSQEENLFGMGHAAHWALIANAFDPSLLRNQTNFQMAKAGNVAYTPESQYVDLYINGEYQGNYLLMEKVEIHDSRIHVKNLEKETEHMNPEVVYSEDDYFVEQKNDIQEEKGVLIENQPVDITGSYILELEASWRYPNVTSGFITAAGQHMEIESPELASKEQVAYIAEFYQDFENALFASDGKNEKGIYHTDYVDLDSFAKKYILEESIKNLDASVTSQYMVKLSNAEGGVLVSGTPWDYDKTLGAEVDWAYGYDISDPNGFYVNEPQVDYDFWHALYTHPDFVNRVKELYKSDFRDAILEQVTNGITKRADLIQTSAVMNGYRWELYKNEGVNRTLSKQEIEQAYKRETEKIQRFLMKRISFLDENWG
ncbi:MAG: CotH kinase family protein [Lachnospiraceae bacterium]|nr:CotH kinase family protein [Lachnospiraceae bacterium]